MSLRLFESAQLAAKYAKCRPKPPRELANRIVSFIRAEFQGPLDLCLDVGCGNGQSSDIYAPHFRRVLATDVSSAQIQEARKLHHPPNVEFQICPAESNPGIERGSVQLVTATAACHWFDLPVFFKETDRLLCCNGVVALSGYGSFDSLFLHPTKSEELHRARSVLFMEQLGKYWTSRKQLVENEYADINIPYQDTVRSHAWKRDTVSLADFATYCTTVSAYQNFCAANGESAGKELIEEFIATCQYALQQSNQDPHDIDIVIKRKYYLIMGRKI